MNEDCVFLILEHLDFGDLMNVAQISDDFSMIAADLYRYKFSHLTIAFEDQFRLSSNVNELQNVADMDIDSNAIARVNSEHYSFEEPFKVTKTEIKLGNCDLILNTFKHFGHFIKNIKHGIYLEDQLIQVELIGKLINKYSSESLKDVFFQKRIDELLKYIKNPLVNVENVTFFLGFMSSNSQILGPNELFPAVRRLYLQSLTENELTYFDCHMPNLEHLKIAQTNNYVDTSRFIGIIIKNPQIKSIDLYGTNPKLIPAASTYLPQLETLTLFNFDLKNERIQFENVTTFSIGSGFGFYTTPINIHIPRLQNFCAEYNACQYDDYLEFLNEHKHLRRLHLDIHDLNDSQLQELTANLTNLVEMKLERKRQCETDNISSNSILSFLETHDKVNQFNVINFPEHRENELQEQLASGWKTKIIERGFSFERQNFRC